MNMKGAYGSCIEIDQIRWSGGLDTGARSVATAYRVRVKNKEATAGVHLIIVSVLTWGAPVFTQDLWEEIQRQPDEQSHGPGTTRKIPQNISKWYSNDAKVG